MLEHSSQRQPRRGNSRTVLGLAAFGVLSGVVNGQNPPPTPPPSDASAVTPAVPVPVPPPADSRIEELPKIDRPKLTQASSQRLARTLTALAGKSIRKDQLAIADLDLSLALAENATLLDPKNVDAWRTLYWISLANDQTDERIQELRKKALDQIVKLDPADEVMRLRRLVDLIEREETADGRIAKHLALLTKENIEILGKPVAARLALDLALLLRRTGDQAGFERWLAEAVTLDPAFPAATTMAAGYFRFATDDPTKVAELLVAAMLANPLDSLAIRALSSLLLEEGAYVGAARFMGIAARMEYTDFPLISYDEILSDHLLTQLASRAYEAVDLGVRTRQKELNDYVRIEMSRSDPSMLGDPRRLEAQTLPVQQQQAAIRLAALMSIGDESRVKEAREALFVSLDAAIGRAKTARESATSDEARADGVSMEAATLLEAVFLGVWLGEDAEKSRAYLTAADAMLPITDAAKARFEAFAALRSGDPVKALELFAAVNDESSLTRLGRALALQASGNSRDAAKELLAVWRAEPSSLVGIDAKRRLEAMLDTQLTLGEEAARVEAVAAAVPTSFDRMFAPDARVLRMRIRRGEEPQNAFDAMPISIEITNESPFPFSIDPAGPLRDVMSAEMTVVASGQSTSLELPPHMINIARAFTIPSRKTLVIPFDIAYTDAGAFATNTTAMGCGITLHAIANWEASIGGVRPGLFGDDADLGLLRIEGASFSEEWFNATLSAMRDPTTPEQLFDIVAATYIATDAVRRPEGFPPEVRSALDKLWPELSALLPRLDPVSQAWFVTVLPDSTPPLESALDSIRNTTERLPRFMYLIRRATRSTDPVIDAAIRSDDPLLARYGRLVKDMLFNEEERVRRDFNLGGGAPGPDGSTVPPTPPAEAPPPTSAPKP